MAFWNKGKGEFDIIVGGLAVMVDRLHDYARRQQERGNAKRAVVSKLDKEVHSHANESQRALNVAGNIAKLIATPATGMPAEKGHGGQSASVPR